MTNRQGDKPISKTSSARAGTRIKKQVVTLSPTTQQFIQRCPTRLKPPTEAQLKAREWFAENLPGRKWREYRESQCGNRVVCEEMRKRG